VLTLFKGTETTWQSASFFIKWETTLCNVSIAELDMGTTLLTVPLFIILGTTWRKASYIHSLGDNLCIVQGVSFL
jgi:hypothetical protein